MVVAGAAALIIPTAAMAEWDQSESHNNQKSHDAMINVNTTTNTAIGDFTYSMYSPIGYEYIAGKVNMATSSPYSSKGQAPWNTTPCPIQLADTAAAYTWEVAMGNCPTQVQANGWTMGQTNQGWAEGDNELYGPILDDLYQSLSETASSPKNENNQKAFKKVDQVLDILFYRANTVGEVYGQDGWYENEGADTGIHWFGGLGLDQTLDQDVADIEGTTGNNIQAKAEHGTWLWNYDHLAQTFYQDFQLFDKGNTFGGAGDVNGNGEIEYTGGSTPGADYVNLATATKYQRGQSNVRNRHGIELLAICAGAGVCTYDTAQSDPLYPGWGVYTLDAQDFAFFDQWVIQSLRDSYTQAYDGSAAFGYQTFTGSVALAQSYSSWMALGVPGKVCDVANNDALNPSGECTYVYNKDAHAVNKSIAPNKSTHQTGDP